MNSFATLSTLGTLDTLNTFSTLYEDTQITCPGKKYIQIV